MNQKHQKNQGFTLIELMVSVAIFALVVVGAMGVMVNVFGAQEKAIALKEVLDNARFPIELMTREVRTATNIQDPVQPPGCPIAGIQFTSHNEGTAQERFYYLDTVAGIIMRVAMQSAGSIDCAQAQELTAKEVIIDNGFGEVQGLMFGPNNGQPRITFGFRVRSRNTSLRADTAISVQTTITQRLRDL